MAVDVRKALKKISPDLIKAKDENLNEANTRELIIKVFEDVFGYEITTEITLELPIKSKYADIAIKINDKTRLLIEVKAAYIKLNPNHTDQAEWYASHEKECRWVVLTNGTVWNLYYITCDGPVGNELTFSVDLSADDLDKVVTKLNLLHKQSIKNNLLEDYLSTHDALSPESIGKLLFTKDVLFHIRRVIRKHKGILIDIEDLVKAVLDMLSPEAKERIGPIRIPRNEKKKTGKSLSNLPLEPNTNVTQVSQDNSQTNVTDRPA